MAELFQPTSAQIRDVIGLPETLLKLGPVHSIIETASVLDLGPTADVMLSLDDVADKIFARKDLDVLGNVVQFTERALPANPPANQGKLYIRDLATVTTLFFLDSGGTETNLLLGGGGGEANTISTTGAGIDISATPSKVGVDLRVKSISVTAPIALADVTNDLGLSLNALVNADISASAAIQLSKLENLTSARLIVGSATNVPTARDITGDVTISNTGITTIGANTINDSKISAHTSTKITIIAKGQLNSNIVYTDQANTFGAFAQRFPTTQLQLDNPAATFQYIFATSAIIADRNVTLPLLTSNDVFVFESHSQILVNKTLTTPTIASFVNATHTHLNAAGGGTITRTAISDFDHDLLSTQHSDTLASAVSEGSIIIGNVTPAWNELVIGAADNLLISNATTLIYGKIANVNLTSGVFGAITGIGVQTQDFDLSTNFMDIGEIATPLDPAANVGRLYVKDLATVTTLFFRDSAGTETNVLTGVAGEFFGPWTADHDAGGFDLLNVGGIQINNPADTFQYIITPAAIIADRIVNLPLLATTDTITMDAFGTTLTNKTMTAAANTFSGFAIGAEVTGASTDLTDTGVIVRTDQINTFGAFAQTFSNDTLTLLDSAAAEVLIRVAVQGANRQVTFPALAVSLGEILITNVGQTITSSKIFNDLRLFLRNVADTFDVTFTNTVTADRILTLPDAAGTVVITGLSSQITIGTEVTGASTALTDTADIAYLNTANTFIAGNKNTFAHSATTAGIAVLPVAGNPSGQADGDLWLNLTTQQLFARINGADVDLGGAGTSLPVVDTTSIAEGSTDATKEVRFEVDGNTTGIIGVIATIFTTAKTITLPDATDTLMGKATTDIMINKSLDANGTGNVITNIGDAEIEAHTSTKITITAKGQLNSAIVYTDQINTFGDFVQTFKDNTLHLENPAGTFDVVFQTSAEITSDRILTIPLLGANRTMVVTGLASQIVIGTEVTGASTALTDTDDIAYLNQANTFGAFLNSFAGSTMRIPVSATPTIAVNGDIAIDTTITDFTTPLIRYFGTESMVVIAVPDAQIVTPTGGHVITYNATTDEFELVAATGGEFTGAWTADHNIGGSAFSLQDARFADPTDNTKTIQLNLAGMTTAIELTISTSQSTARTITIPNIGANRSFVVTGETSQIVIGTEVTGASTALTDTADIAYLNTNNTYATNTVQTFTPDASNAGINVGSFAGEPTGANGELVYDSTANQMKGFVNGAWVDLGQSGSEVFTWTADHSAADFDMLAKPTPNTDFFQLLVEVIAGDDVGTEPMYHINLRRDTPAAVTARNLFEISNNDVAQFVINNNGDIDLFQNAIQFSTDGHSITPTGNSLNIDTSAIGDEIKLQTGGSDRVKIDFNSIVFLATIALGTNRIQFNNSGTTIRQITDDLEYDVATGNSHRFRINDVTEMELFAASLTLAAGNNIVLTASGALGLITMGELTTPATPVGNTGSYYVKDVGTISTAFFIGDDGVEINLTTGAEVFTWTADHGAAGFDLNNLSNLVFQNSASVPLSTERSIHYNDAEGMVFNALTGDVYRLEINGALEYNFSATEANWFGNSIFDVGFFETNATNPAAVGEIRLGNTDEIHWRNAGNTDDNRLAFAASVFEIQISVGADYSFSSTAFTLEAGNNILMGASGALGFIEMGELTTPATPTANLGKYYVKDVGTISTAFFIGDDGVEINLTTGAEVTTWTADHSMATFKLTASAANNVILNAPTGQGVSIEVNAIQEYLFNATDADFLGNNIRNVAFFESNAATPASAGAIRLGNNETVAWDLVGAGNGEIRFDGSDDFQFRKNGATLVQLTSNFLNVLGLEIRNAQFFETDAATPATAGALRFGNAEFVAWRNAGNTANLGILFNASDQFAFVGTTEIFASNIFTNHPALASADPAADTLLIRDATDGLIKEIFPNDLGLGGGEVFIWSANHDANGFALEDARIADDTDNTKIIDFNLVGMTTGITAILDFNFTTAKTITFPDATTTMVGTGIANQIGDTEITAHTSTKITIIAKGQLNSAIVYNDQINVFGDFDQTFKDNRLRIENPAGTFEVQFQTSAEIADRILTIPLLGADRTLIVIGLADQIGNTEIASHTSTKITITAKGQLNANIVYNDQTNVFGDFDQDFKDNRLRIFNPADTFPFTFVASAIASALNITLPLITVNTNMVVTDFANIWGTQNQNIATTGEWREAGIAISPVGTHDDYYDAGMMVEVTSATPDTVLIGTTGNRKGVLKMDFSAADEFATIKLTPPRNWDAGTITVVLKFTTGVEGAGTIIWGVSGVAVADLDDLSAAATNYGGEITVTDTQTTINQEQFSPRTLAITLANTPVAGDSVYLKIRRDGAVDTFPNIAFLLGIFVEWGINAATAT